MDNSNDDVAAIILSGGGAYAAYELGVIRALFSGQSPSTDYKPLRPEIITGTSSGALTAALIACMSNHDPTSAAEHAADIWLDEVADQGDGCGNGVFRYRANPFEGFEPACAPPTVTLSHLLNDAASLSQNFITRATQFFTSPSSLEQRVLELVDLSAVISTEPLAKLIQRTIKLEQIRSSLIRLVVATTNWKTGDLRLFENQEMTDDSGHEIIRASASLPGIFPSVEIQNEPYVDGGVVMNTPLKPAIERGASVLHIIYINPDVVRIPLPRVRSTMNALFRSLVINLATNINQDIATAKQVNRGIRLLQHPEQLRTASDFRTLVTQISGIARHLEQDTHAYRLLTIHRYHPQEMYGGLFQWLSFGRNHLLTLMQRGFADTLKHDCQANGCLLPNHIHSLTAPD